MSEEERAAAGLRELTHTLARNFQQMKTGSKERAKVLDALVNLVVVAERLNMPVDVLGTIADIAAEAQEVASDGADDD